MTPGWIIAAVVLGGFLFGWWMHRRTARRLSPILQQLAVEKDGIVKPGRLGGLPKLMLSHRGKPMEISAASTGTSNGSSEYTYVLFREVEPAAFSFRILPKSTQSLIDNALGLKKTVRTGEPLMDKYFSIHTDNEDSIRTLLAGRIQPVIASWLPPGRNLIQDIRNYDDKLIVCIDGTLGDYSEMERLIDGACVVYDEVERVSGRKIRR